MIFRIDNYVSTRQLVSAKKILSAIEPSKFYTSEGLSEIGASWEVLNLFNGIAKIPSNTVLRAVALDIGGVELSDINRDEWFEVACERIRKETHRILMLCFDPLCPKCKKPIDGCYGGCLACDLADDLA